MNPRHRFWRNAFLLGLLQAVLSLIILYTTKWIGFPVSTSTFIIVCFIFLIVCLSFLAPIISSRSIFTGRDFPEFDRFVRRFDDAGGKLIDDAFGHKTYARLYNEEISQMQWDAIEICRDLLGQKESRENEDLQFHLRIKHARFLIKEERYRDAIKELNIALSIRPTDLIANFLAAESHERLGEGEAATMHYIAALEDPASVSRGIRETVESQISRVQNNGPRIAGPQAGFRFMTH